MGKVYKVEKVRSTFHTFHDYLNFCGEKKDDRLFTIYTITVRNRNNKRDTKNDRRNGRILETENSEQLLDFYEKKNQFKRFDIRESSTKKDLNYIQLLKIL